VIKEDLNQKKEVDLSQILVKGKEKKENYKKDWPELEP